jgi:gamma-glutamyl-gamma-aminobutyrate hydrolase PuuD
MTRVSRPRIGVTIGPGREGSADLTLRSTYLQAIERSGGSPLLVPPVGPETLRAILNQLDGIVFPGGPDIHPDIYGANRHPKTHTNRALDRLELAAASWAVNADIPVLGICRGQQLINVVLGGSLTQHLPRHRGSFRRRTFSHPLEIEHGSRLARVLETTETEVNSFHHQAVNRLGAGLMAVGWAPDGTVEALESSHHPWLVTVQFHPEELISTHLPSQRLFAAFIAACRHGRDAAPTMSEGARQSTMR